MFLLQDYLGIAWLIAASVNAFVVRSRPGALQLSIFKLTHPLSSLQYFAFYCQPTSLILYTALNLGVAVRELLLSGSDLVSDG